jgi:hypothetical protein
MMACSTDTVPLYSGKRSYIVMSSEARSCTVSSFMPGVKKTLSL